MQIAISFVIIFKLQILARKVHNENTKIVGMLLFTFFLLPRYINFFNYNLYQKYSFDDLNSDLNIQVTQTEEKYQLTALFNNMQTLKFKAQPTNAFFATVNQMFSSSSQLPTTAERAVIKSNRLDNIVGSWEELPNSWLAVAKNAFVGWALNFRVRMLLKSAVRTWNTLCILFLWTLWLNIL